MKIFYFYDENSTHFTSFIAIVQYYRTFIFIVVAKGVQTIVIIYKDSSYLEWNEVKIQKN